VGRPFDAGRLALVFAHEIPIDAGFYLVWPRNARAVPGLADVRQWLLEQAALPGDRKSTE
jgi:DNA-binding transcriptional LysR family regulator